MENKYQNLKSNIIKNRIMQNKIKIAIDAMGGDNSPKKIIDGINISLK